MGLIIGNGIWIGRNSGGSSAPNGAPSNLVLTVVSDTEIDGTFTEGSTNQDGFRIYISTDNVTFTEKTTVASGSFQATGLTANTKYYLYVVAYKGSTESTATDTENATTWYSQLATTWLPALKTVDSSRASISVIGDSITGGVLTTDMDINPFVVVLRNLLQADYGNGGEGFLSAYHGYDPTGTPHDHRWTYSANWTRSYADSFTGMGAIASNIYTLQLNKTATLTFTGDTIQIINAINHANGALLEVKIDGTVKTNIDIRGDGVTEHLHYGNVTTITGLGSGSHTLLLTSKDNPASAPDYAWFEGVRPLIGNAGVVVDRFGKGWMQANWLGTINESNVSNPFFETLKVCTEKLDTDLFIVALGINDYIKQVALATFETQLTTIVQRCKAVADTIIYATPQPNSALTIPYSDYVTKMSAVATAQGCLFIDSRDVFGATFNAGLMADNNHPNDTGHDKIADQIYAKIIL